MVAQMSLGVALSRAYIAKHGPPHVLAEKAWVSSPPIASPARFLWRKTAQLTYRWARDLATVSDRLDLRMAVVEDLDEDTWNGIRRPVQANLVVSESAHLFVAALPSRHLDELDREVTGRGGRTLVSNNPCAAHEPRLAEVGRSGMSMRTSWLLSPLPRRRFLWFPPSSPANRWPIRNRCAAIGWTRPSTGCVGGRLSVRWRHGGPSLDPVRTYLVWLCLEEAAR